MTNSRTPIAPGRLGRRDFLAASLTAAGAFVSTALPAAASAQGAHAPLIPDGGGWSHSFVLSRDPLHLNTGTVGSPALAVLNAMDSVARGTAVAPLHTYETRLYDVRAAIAPGFGCSADELCISGNTTAGLCAVVAGLDLQVGDEVLTTNHEHSGSMSPLAILRDRRGISIKQVVLPVGGNQSPQQYVDLFANAITASTKVMLFSAPTFLTGVMLPIRDLVALARTKKIVTVVDGAHIPGMMAYNFRDLGVDFLAGTFAKWQCGPAQTGILYIRNKPSTTHPLPTFWPTFTMDYPDRQPAQKGGPRVNDNAATYDIGGLLQYVGNSSLAQLEGVRVACAMWDRIGRQVIQEYALGLANQLKVAIVREWGAAALYSPAISGLTSAMTTFNPFRNPDDIKDKARSEVFVNRLLDQHRIRARNTTVPTPTGPIYPVRVSTHLYNTSGDVARFVTEAVRLADALHTR